MAGENIDPTKFCDDCRHLGLSENEQNRLKKVNGWAKDHRCNKYQCQVLHLGAHPRILRCGVCLDNNSFEPITE